MTWRFWAIVLSWLALVAAMIGGGIYLNNMLGNVLIGFGIIGGGLFIWVIMRSARILFTGG